MWADYLNIFYCKKCEEDIPALEMKSNLQYTIDKLQKAVKDIDRRLSGKRKK